MEQTNQIGAFLERISRFALQAHALNKIGSYSDCRQPNSYMGGAIIFRRK